MCLGGELRRWLVGSALRLKFSNRISVGRHPILRGTNFIQFGRRFRAGDFLWIEALAEDSAEIAPTIIIKDDVNASQFVHIAATHYVEIGNGVLLGSKVIITDHNHGSYKGEAQSSPEIKPTDRPLSRGLRTIVGDRVWLGDGVVVSPGAKIGQGSVIGANSVVVGELPENCLAIGTPARVIKRFQPELGRWMKLP